MSNPETLSSEAATRVDEVDPEDHGAVIAALDRELDAAQAIADCLNGCELVAPMDAAVGYAEVVLEALSDAGYAVVAGGGSAPPELAHQGTQRAVPRLFWHREHGVVRGGSPSATNLQLYYREPLEPTGEGDLVKVPRRWAEEVVLALEAATVIGERSCRDGDHLHYANHERLVLEARGLLDQEGVTPELRQAMQAYDAVPYDHEMQKERARDALAEAVRAFLGR